MKKLNIGSLVDKLINKLIDFFKIKIGIFMIDWMCEFFFGVNGFFLP